MNEPEKTIGESQPADTASIIKSLYLEREKPNLMGIVEDRLFHFGGTTEGEELESIFERSTLKEYISAWDELYERLDFTSDQTYADWNIREWYSSIELYKKIHTEFSAVSHAKKIADKLQMLKKCFSKFEKLVSRKKLNELWSILGSVKSRLSDKKYEERIRSLNDQTDYENYGPDESDIEIERLRSVNDNLDERIKTLSSTLEDMSSGELNKGFTTFRDELAGSENNARWALIGTTIILLIAIFSVVIAPIFSLFFYKLLSFFSQEIGGVIVTTLEVNKGGFILSHYSFLGICATAVIYFAYQYAFFRKMRLEMENKITLITAYRMIRSRDSLENTPGLFGAFAKIIFSPLFSSNERVESGLPITQIFHAATDAASSRK